ncbi:MAG: hypothetical protein M1817_000219 [Caeruleum heppii]|nr:MAG: hypothetical protein M1817_000219 [Caeruleum heppii]
MTRSPYYPFELEFDHHPARGAARVRVPSSAPMVGQLRRRRTRETRSDNSRHVVVSDAVAVESARSGVVETLETEDFATTAKRLESIPANANSSGQVGSKSIATPEDTQTSASHFSYPMHTPGTTVSAYSQLTGALGNYPGGSASNVASSGSALSGGGGIYYGRMPSSQGPSSSQHSMLPPRQNYLHNLMGYSDDGSDSYQAVSSQYTLPSNDSLGSNYGLPDARAYPMGSRSSASGMFVEQDSPTYGSGAQMPYVGSSSRTASVTTDGTSLWPSMTSLSSSLPHMPHSNDRVLPRPQQSGGSVSGSVGMTNDGTSLTYGSGQGSSYRTWGSESGPTAGSERGSNHSSSTVMGAPASKGSLSSQDAFLPYLSLSSSPDHSSSSTNSLSYSNASLPAPITPQGHSYPSSASSNSFPAANSNETLLTSHGSSGNLYAYTSDPSGGYGKRHPSLGGEGSSGGGGGSGDGTLVSGQPYTRLRQPQPQAQHMASLEALQRRGSREHRGQQVGHRSSAGSFRS